jgi:hypothetical protein
MSILDIFGDDKDAGAGNTANAIASIQGIRVPTTEEQYAELQDLVQQGVLTPEEAIAYLQNQSEMGNIQVDPQFLEQAREEMRYLADVAQQGGMTAGMRARLNEGVRTMEQETSAQTKAIIEDAARRGITGSGVELGGRLLAAQGSANRAADTGVQAAADAEARAMEAAKGAGALGTQLNAQEFGQEADVARAMDDVARFNVTARQNVENANVAARNKAKEVTLAEKQRISDANAAAKNEEAVRRAGLTQAEFQNRLAKGTAVAGVYESAAEAERKRKEAEAAGEAGLFTGLLGAGAQLGSAYMTKGK